MIVLRQAQGERAVFEVYQTPFVKLNNHFSIILNKVNRKINFFLPLLRLRVISGIIRKATELTNETIPMLFKLFLAFTVIPAVELYLLIEIGSQLGALTTLGIVLGTGFLGAHLARMEGLNTLLRVREAAMEGRSPADDLLDGALIVAAGLVLITPGFLTDLTGLILLFPPTRYPIREWLKSRLKRHFTVSPPPPDDDVIIQQ